MRQNVYTHYFKEAVVENGVKYQHVVGLNEVYDWRLILDLAGDPAWQLVTLKRPPVCRFPGEKRRFSLLRPKVRCPGCGNRMRECEDRYPDGVGSAFLLPSRPRRLELWHDDEAVCGHCGARVGMTLRRPALPAPAKKPSLAKKAGIA